ncbi:MAG: ubiquinol-cytochrome C chaperone family protein [Candidatus Puniceispirillaceae bacterium]
MSEVGIFASLKKMFGGKQIAPLPTTKAEDLYHQVLQASRSVTLFQDYHVQDDIDGRFDALCLVQSLVMRRLTGHSEALADLSQGLFDAMFADMDLTLREMGVGDMGVGKRVKFMSEAYMGRLKAYDEALKQKDSEALEDALSRNLYRQKGSPSIIKALANEVVAMVGRLEEIDDSVLEQASLPTGCLQFGPSQ